MRKNPYDIIFYYPQHFNRTKQGNNSLFNPLINICKSKNIHYLVLEEPNKKCSHPRNKQANQFDIYFNIIIILRKIIPLMLFKKLEKKEQWIGKIMRKITYAKFDANVILTLSNSMGSFWRGYNKLAKIIDYQHGIIDKNQNGFFNKGKVSNHILENKKEVAVWGRGFYNIFKQDKKYYKNKVHILGYPQFINNNKKVTKYNNEIIFSLPIVPELNNTVKKEILIQTKNILTELDSLLDNEKPKVLLLKHPRHDNTIDLKNLLKDFKFASINTENKSLANKKYLLHITFYSTTTFEMAMKGIPTYFIKSEKISYSKIFIEEYKYPIPQNNSCKELVRTYQKHKNIRKSHSDLVENWSKDYFEPINKNVFLNIINFENEEN